MLNLLRREICGLVNESRSTKASQLLILVTKGLEKAEKEFSKLFM